MTYRFTIGTDDPHQIDAVDDQDAVVRTVEVLRADHMDDLRRRPEAVLTLLGPDGLVSHPSERLDAFVERLATSNPAADPDRMQPGDSTTPDCNIE